MGQVWIAVGALLMGLGVGMGAFGAHALKNVFTPYSQAIYQTAVQYHFYHALGLMALGFFMKLFPEIASNSSGLIVALLFVAGIIIFCGSLYALAITEIKLLGAITPLGGVAFILGHLYFAYLAYKAI
ncbi:MAG: DUF423 domain-containing protein [Oligoflexia bacterium]|nr:DUF423 domain-containing protein [Oligoflexia bacterium]